MPPLRIPKHPAICQPLTDEIYNNRAQKGPPTTKFNLVDAKTLDDNFFELAAAQKLGRVYHLIRSCRHDATSRDIDNIGQLLKDIEIYITMLKLRARRTSSWSGIILSLGYCIFYQT